MSLAFAVIAAFVVILAGFLSDVRIGTILLRGFLGFLVAGLVGYLFVAFFEAKQMELERAQPRDQDDEQMAYIPDDEEYSSEEEEQTGESEEFQPLEEQDLDHVQPPES